MFAVLFVVGHFYVSIFLPPHITSYNRSIHDNFRTRRLQIVQCSSTTHQLVVVVNDTIKLAHVLFIFLNQNCIKTFIPISQAMHAMKLMLN